jgi:hypothetical protein
MIYKLLRSLLAVLPLSSALARTFVISPNEGDCPSFAALQASFALLPGDVVEFQAATRGGSASFHETIQPRSGGALGYPLTIRARPGDLITIDADHKLVKCAYISVPYVILDGFYFKNATNIGLSGVITINNAPHVTIQNCHILISFFGIDDGHHGRDRRGIAAVNDCDGLIMQDNTIMTETGIWHSGDTDGMLVGSKGTIIRRNVIRLRNKDMTPGGGHNDCIQTANAADLTIESNIADRDVGTPTTSGQGIYVEFYNLDDQNVTNYGTCDIRNNIVFGQAGSYLLCTVARTKGSLRKDPVIAITVANNTVDSFDTIGGLPARFTEGTPHDIWVGGSLKVLNNIFIARRTKAPIVVVQITPPYSRGDIVCDYNHLYPMHAGAADPIATFNGKFYSWAGWHEAGMDTHGIGLRGSSWVDPKFIDRQSYDYRLANDSPDIGAAANLSPIFKTDLLNAPRPVRLSWDIGAYEHLRDGEVAPFVR